MRAAIRTPLRVFAFSAFTLVATSQFSVAADFDQTRIEPVAETVEEPDRGWHIVISPYIWGASLSGKTGVANLTSDVDVPFSETLENLDFALMGMIDVTNGEWGGFVDGQYVSASQDRDLLSRELEIKLTQTNIAGGLYYRVYEHALGGNTVYGNPRVFALEPTAGVRWNQMKVRLDVGAFSAEKKKEWTDPFLGVRLHADLDERWNIFAEGDVGGFDVGSKLSVNAQAYLGYRTTFFNQPTILRAGYRVYYTEYESDDFTGRSKFRWDVTQHGPVVGFSMRF